MTSREHRAALKKWREHCAAYRAKQKDATVALNTPRANMLSSDQGSPCSSAGCNTSVSIDFPSNQIPTVTAINSHRRRQVKKRREKVNKEKDEKIEALKKKVDKYRKRITRLQNRSKKNKADTPNTKMQKMLNEPGGRKEVVKKALFSDVLNEQLKENYSNLKCIKDKQIFTKVLSGVRLQKYRRCIPRDCGVLYRGVQSTKRYNTLTVPVMRRIRIPIRYYKQALRSFFEDDSNSRIGAGKKEYVTKQNVRKQKRYLLDTILNLYKKMLANNFKISYQTFCGLRPFWIVRPSTQNRDTCLCVTHSNLDMKLRALYDAKIIAYNNYQKLLEQLCCDRYNENCLSRRCLLCKNRLPKYKEFNDKRIIKYKMWVQERQEIIDLKTKKPKIVIKHLKMVYNGHPVK
ncbi:unnamed protein product [Acanthoscelides obtectus]|uniref:Uncharacterized protein n=1 Tax=Acanthoscelides obtectus TaxID=200917 RepID=A0A9P0Q095_ACAOB|nr:unnamed protein product [Acanthoscelides obtectus]CAK1634046.1 hypothetical protein AOBTE_LOCUS8560 [Acanthoscelides obtectus]